MRRMVVTSVALDRDQKRRLDALVLLRRKSRSFLVREALEALLGTFARQGGCEVVVEGDVDGAVAP